MQSTFVKQGLFLKTRILTSAVAIAIAAGGAQGSASAGGRDPSSLFRLPAASAEFPLAAAGAQAASKGAGSIFRPATPSAAGAGVASAAAQVLPAPTGPGAPFRQTMTGDCSFTSPLPDWSSFTFCRFAPVVVPASRLLEIENVSCLIKPVIGVFLLSKSGDVSRLFGSIVGSVINATSSPQGGPFYFGPGERIYIWGIGDPGSPACCAVHGLLSPTV